VEFKRFVGRQMARDILNAAYGFLPMRIPSSMRFGYEIQVREPPLEDLIAREGEPLEAIIMQDLLEWLSKALVCLPTKQRRAVVQHWLYGQTFEEIAKEIGCTRQAVHCRARRGLAILKARLKGLVQGL